MLQHNGGTIANFETDKISGKTINYGIKFKFYDDELPIYIGIDTLFNFEAFDDGNYHFIGDDEDGFNRSKYGNYSNGHLLIGDTNDFGVGILTMDLNKDDYGAIYRFSQGLYYANPERNLIRLANSFEEIPENY